jgi:glycosyltransferase involved in cell wall biosynthesis
MRILHVVESLERGGLERVVINLVLAQSAAGHQVAVNCLFREGLLAAELHLAGVPVACAGKRTGIDLKALARLRANARSFGAELVHSHNAVANYYAAAALLGRRTGLVNTRHGMGAGAQARKEKLYRLSLRRTAAVATVCVAARASFAASGLVPDSMLHVVLNGVDISAFDGSGPSADAARTALELPTDAFVVGTVGRLNPAKNHARLLDAFALLHARLPRSRLVIVGGGALRDDLTARIARLGLGDAVTMCGDRSDVAALLPAFDVFALTSDTEGYSVALLEAGAAALPCVVSDVGGNAEIVQDGVTGIIVRPADAAGFAAALAQLADRARARQLGRAARSWVQAHGSVAAMARAYDVFYGNALAGNRSEATAA